LRQHRRQVNAARQRIIVPGQGKLHPHQLRPPLAFRYHGRRERPAQSLSA
jgi:hypothetical protein